MPGYKAHALVGSLTFIAFLCLLQKIFLFSCAFLTALSCFFVTVIGSLFPDVDTKSKGQMIFYQCVLFYLLFLLWYQKFTTFMMVTCIMMLPLLVPHRGLFHRISFLGFLWMAGSLGSFLIIPLKAYDSIMHLSFFFIGALSHVMLDRLQTRIKYL